MSIPVKKNRLINEKSPYLLQHADNPVDWYPWGDEALNKAKSENKLIFLSIGYSTCHWCHVMAHESFESMEVAKVLNDNFVPIKVDREERPDIDSIYMSAVSAMTGQGGWPLTAVLTPDKKPFWGGTYIPLYPKWGSPGLIDILQSIQHSWIQNREQILHSSGSIAKILQEQKTIDRRHEVVFSHEQLHEAFEQFQGSFDKRFGGFGVSPKFPSSHNLSFLLRYWRRTKKDDALEMVLTTLRKMAEGGIYDQLGGGFHRYSTDQEWQVPHFEKMLYDQAMLARSYVEAYQVTQDEFNARIAREICDYVLRDMCSAEGAFYSAEDADSLDPDFPEDKHKKEGAFFVWRFQEIKESLSNEEFEVFKFIYDLEPDGNIRLDPHGEFESKNILCVVNTIQQAMEKFGLTETQVNKIVANSKAKLLDRRNARPRPHLDDKVIVDWNSMMIATFSTCGRVLNEPRYIIAAKTAMEFILKQMIGQNDRLMHRYRDGESAFHGTLDDYAQLINALLDLFETTFEFKYLEKAIRLAHQMIELFEDPQSYGFFMTGHDAEELIFRPKDVYDGAYPSGNSMAALGMIRLYRLTFNPVWRDKVESIFQAFAADVANRASAYCQLLSVYDQYNSRSCEIVIVVPNQPALIERLEKILNSINQKFIPSKLLIRVIPGSLGYEKICDMIPFVKDKVAIEGKMTMFICENRACQNPVVGEDQILKVVESLF